jgi:glycosyltransferase involved in cell wall biosynthesis
VIIPAFNEERLIGGTLEALSGACAAFAERGWETERIVCDNNSTDRTGELARAAGAKVVFEPVNQISRARNRGASEATGDWLLFLDADSTPSKELFQDVADAIATGRCLAGGCTVKMDGNYRSANRIASVWNWISRRLSWVAGSFIFCEAAAFRALGGFSQVLFAAEEIEFSKRLKKHARERGKSIVILHRHPLVTSPRKVHLYTLREHLWFMARVTLFPGRTLSSRAACRTWYDGRR